MLQRNIGRIIRSSLHIQKRNGIEIIGLDLGVEVNPCNKHKWFSPGGFCNPIGAMILTYQPRPCDNNYRSVYKLFSKFGKNKKWVESFWAGTDGERLTKEELTKLNLRAYRLGKKIRQEFRIWQ